MRSFGHAAPKPTWLYSNQPFVSEICMHETVKGEDLRASSSSGSQAHRGPDQRSCLPQRRC
eukprot:10255952-Alexandrium_andersonii.AAC.1